MSFRESFYGSYIVFFFLFLGEGEGEGGGGVDIINLVVMDYNVHASYDSAAS